MEPDDSYINGVVKVSSTTQACFNFNSNVYPQSEQIVEEVTTSPAHPPFIIFNPSLSEKAIPTIHHHPFAGKNKVFKVGHLCTPLVRLS